MINVIIGLLDMIMHIHISQQVKNMASKKETYDHIHKKTEIFPFEFENAGQLMEDFWSSVNRYIDEN